MDESVSEFNVGGDPENVVASSSDSGEVSVDKSVSKCKLFSGQSLAGYRISISFFS